MDGAAWIPDLGDLVSRHWVGDDGLARASERDGDVHGLRLLPTNPSHLFLRLWLDIQVGERVFAV